MPRRDISHLEILISIALGLVIRECS
jgi:hypothetical protein